MRMQTLLETDRVTAHSRSDHNWQPQPCRQSSTWWSSPSTALLTCSCGSSSGWSARWLSAHQTSAGVWYISSMLPQTNSPAYSNLESLGPLILLNEPAFTCSQFCMTLERWEMEVVLVGKAQLCHFQCTSTKLGGKVYISLFNSCVKFYAKMWTHC